MPDSGLLSEPGTVDASQKSCTETAERSEFPLSGASHQLAGGKTRFIWIKFGDRFLRKANRNRRNPGEEMHLARCLVRSRAAARMGAMTAALIAMFVTGCSSSGSPGNATLAPSSSDLAGTPSIAGAGPSGNAKRASTAASGTRAPAVAKGNINQTVAPVSAPTRPPVKLTKPATPAAATKVSLTSIRAIHVGAVGPGEVAGPALAVTVRVANRTSRPLRLDSASVTLVDAAGQVGTPTPAPPASPLKGAVKPGATAQGVYVFNVPRSTRNMVNIFVSYSAGKPVAHFRGAVR